MASSWRSHHWGLLEPEGGPWIWWVRFLDPWAASSTCELPKVITPGCTTVASPKGGQHRQAGCPVPCTGPAHSRCSIITSVDYLPGWTSPAGSRFWPSSGPVQLSQSLLHLRVYLAALQRHQLPDAVHLSGSLRMKPQSCASTAHPSPSCQSFRSPE